MLDAFGVRTLRLRSGRGLTQDILNAVLIAVDRLLARLDLLLQALQGLRGLHGEGRLEQADRLAHLSARVLRGLEPRRQPSARLLASLLKRLLNRGARRHVLLEHCLRSNQILMLDGLLKLSCSRA